MNLIIGYNDGDGNETRDGSHCLVVSDGHSYSSYSGIVRGHDNSDAAPSAPVTDGYNNMMSGQGASVSRGSENFISGPGASISGGDSNTASDLRASIIGRDSSAASGPFTWMRGGTNTKGGCSPPHLPATPGLV